MHETNPYISRKNKFWSILPRLVYEECWNTTLSTKSKLLVDSTTLMTSVHCFRTKGMEWSTGAWHNIMTRAGYALTGHSQQQDRHRRSHRCCPEGGRGRRGIWRDTCKKTTPQYTARSACQLTVVSHALKLHSPPVAGNVTKPLGVGV